MQNFRMLLYTREIFCSLRTSGMFPSFWHIAATCVLWCECNITSLLLFFGLPTAPRMFTKVVVAPVLDLLPGNSHHWISGQPLTEGTVSAISVSQCLTYDADSVEIWMDPNHQKLMLDQIYHLEYLSLVLDVARSRDFISYGEDAVLPGRLGVGPFWLSRPLCPKERPSTLLLNRWL